MIAIVDAPIVNILIPRHRAEFERLQEDVRELLGKIPNALGARGRLADLLLDHDSSLIVRCERLFDDPDRSPAGTAEQILRDLGGAVNLIRVARGKCATDRPAAECNRPLEEAITAFQRTLQFAEQEQPVPYGRSGYWLV